MNEDITIEEATKMLTAACEWFVFQCPLVECTEKHVILSFKDAKGTIHSKAILKDHLNKSMLEMIFRSLVDSVAVKAIQ